MTRKRATPEMPGNIGHFTDKKKARAVSGLKLVVAGWRRTLKRECPDNRPSEITSISVIISDLGLATRRVKKKIEV